MLTLPLFGAFAANTLPTASADETVEMVGDWTIAENTTVVNRTIVLEGNLFINEGSLKLINSTLMMKCYADGQFRVNIKGELHLVNSTLTADIAENNYYIMVEKSGKLRGENSTIEYAGYRDGERSGVYVLGNIETKNTTFRYNYCPLWAEGLEDREISNMRLYRNSWGMKLISCRNITVRDVSITRNYGTGIRMQDGSENKIEKNTIYVIYRPSESSNGQGIAIENESHDIIRDNRVERTNREGILVTGERSGRNEIINNTLITNGIGAIHLYETSNNTVKENNINSSYMGILLEDSDHNIINGNVIETRVGMKILNSDFNTIVLCELRNIKNYGIMLYSSNKTTISGVNFLNVTMNLYLRNSMAIYAGHMYSDKYRIYGDSKLYLTKWAKATVLDYRGKPMKGVTLELRFMGEEISGGPTYGAGIRGFLAPYAVHTSKSKNYSWCEIKAIYNTSFQENPIRFYSWDKHEIVFREKAPGLNVLVLTDKKEVEPGDTVNLTITVLNKTSPVNNATVDITIGGKPVFPPERIGNGTYSTRIKIPDFENSVKVEVRASLGNQTGNSTLTLMRPYGGNSPSVPEKTGTGSFHWLYVVALLAFFSLMFVSIRKKPLKKDYSSMRPISRDGIEIEK